RSTITVHSFVMYRVGPWHCTWRLPSADATLHLLREAERELHCQESVEPQSPAAQFLAVPQFLGLVPVGNEIDLRFRRGKETFRLEFRSRPLKQKSSVQHARHN